MRSRPLPGPISRVMSDRRRSFGTVVGMLRRTFLLTASASIALLACSARTEEPLGPHPNPSVFQLLIVDHETAFADAGVPYVQALAGEGLLPVEGVELIKLPSYGRDGHRTIEGPTVAASSDRAALERAFEALPEKWRLPSSHALRYGQGSWRPGSDEPLWAAFVVQSDPVVDANGVQRVGLVDDGVGVEVIMTREAGERFAEVSGANVGRKLAIVFNGEVLSDPVIAEAITGGRAVITVGAEPAENEALARALKQALER